MAETTYQYGTTAAPVGTIADQLAIVTRDQALNVAGLQGQQILQNTQNQVGLNDFNAMFAQQNASYLKTYLQGQEQASRTQGLGQLGKVRQSVAASGLKLSGTALDAYNNEQRKASLATQGIQQQGLGQLNQLNNQVANLYAQSSLLTQSGASQAELLLKQADMATHRFI